jgi:hypothetical protein
MRMRQAPAARARAGEAARSTRSSRCGDPCYETAARRGPAEIDDGAALARNAGSGRDPHAAP